MLVLSMGFPFLLKNIGPDSIPDFFDIWDQKFLHQCGDQYDPLFVFTVYDRLAGDHGFSGNIPEFADSYTRPAYRPYHQRRLFIICGVQEPFIFQSAQFLILPGKDLFLNLDISDAECFHIFKPEITVERGYHGIDAGRSISLRQIRLIPDRRLLVQIIIPEKNREFFNVSYILLDSCFALLFTVQMFFKSFYVSRPYLLFFSCCPSLTICLRYFIPLRS